MKLISYYVCPKICYNADAISNVFTKIVASCFCDCKENPHSLK